MISIHNGKLKLNHERFIFPGGEIGVRLEHSYKFFESGQIQIIARLTNANDLMELVMVTDAIRRIAPEAGIWLDMPYVPYARQDRVCNQGEALSLRAFANIINNLGFSRVTVLDPHSDVVAAVINRCVVLNQTRIFGAFDKLQQHIMQRNCYFISPDAGAIKKTEALVLYFNRGGFIKAEKKRELATGKIIETIVHDDGMLSGSEAFIADDICDGGRTFIELAKVLKDKGAHSITLYVTHGIFSKGTKPLYDAGIDFIFTTDSFYKTWPDGISERVVTLKTDEAFFLHT